MTPLYVYHHPDSLAVEHVVHTYPADYDPRCNGEHFVRHHETVPHERIAVIREDGVVTAVVKRDMPVAMPSGRITLGETIALLDVPPGAAVAVNDVAQGTMDEDGRLELTPASTGFYRLRLTLAGYMDWEATLEVVA